MGSAQPLRPPLGLLKDFHSLHFEACYYQGLEHCIEQGLERFEPGAQGEHKVARGFLPTRTWSAHWIADEAFPPAHRRLSGARDRRHGRLHRRDAATQPLQTFRRRATGAALIRPPSRLPYLLAPNDPSARFPATCSEALTEPDGLLAIGGDLGIKRLINAYRHGIFPWYSEGDPILWWSPDPRTVLRPNDCASPAACASCCASGPTASPWTATSRP
jgi:hypothetical protein